MNAKYLKKTEIFKDGQLIKTHQTTNKELVICSLCYTLLHNKVGKGTVDTTVHYADSDYYYQSIQFKYYNNKDLAQIDTFTIPYVYDEDSNYSDEKPYQYDDDDYEIIKNKK